MYVYTYINLSINFLHVNDETKCANRNTTYNIQQDL